MRMIMKVRVLVILSALVFSDTAKSEKNPPDDPVKPSVSKPADGEKPLQNTVFDAPEFLKQLRPRIEAVEAKLVTLKKSFDEAKDAATRAQIAYQAIVEQRKIQAVEELSLLALAYYYCDLAGIVKTVNPVICRGTQLGLRNITLLNDIKAHRQNKQMQEQVNAEIEKNRKEIFEILCAIKRAIADMKDDVVVLDANSKKYDITYLPSPYPEYIKWGRHTKFVGKNKTKAYRDVEEFVYYKMFTLYRQHGTVLKFHEPTVKKNGTPYPPKFPEGIPTKEQVEAAKKAGVEPVIDLDLGRGVTIRMVFIPPGQFMMGGEGAGLLYANVEATPVHKVTVAKGFYMSITEITQDQWLSLMNINPSTSKSFNQKIGVSDTSNFPVDNFTAEQVREFIKKLNSLLKTESFRLPSEAEWEYACKAGTKTKYYFGDDDKLMNQYENFADKQSFMINFLFSDNDSSDGYVYMAPVGQFKPNPWGLYDMLGNMSEICADDPHLNYADAPVDGKPWMEEMAGMKPRLEFMHIFVFRGGCYNEIAENLKSFRRSIGEVPMSYNVPVGSKMNFVGFRVVKILQ